MKKFCLALLVILTILSVNVSAKTVTATIPDYSFVIGNSSVYYQDSEYPLLSYKNVTYLPMTYDYCKALNISVAWDNTSGLYIAYQNHLEHYLPVYPTAVNKKNNKATVCEYPIYVNGKLYDNKSAAYPFLNFRGVTYCPLTWDMAHGEFGMTVNFVPGQLSVNADNATYYSVYNYANSLPDGFTVYSHKQEPVILEDGRTAIINKPYYEKFDYASQALVPYPQGSETPVRQYIRHEVEVKDDGFYLKGQLLPEIVPIDKTDTDKEIATFSQSAYALEYTLATKSFYEINYSSHIDYTDGSMSKMTKTYTYTDVYGNLKFIAENVYIPTAVSCADGNVYFSTCRTAKAIARTYRSSAHKLYRLSPNGDLTLINDLYPQYGCMELLGEVNGIMYLRCVWMPSYNGMVGKAYEASPSNDGYFTYNGQDLVKLYNYVYADHSVLSPTGEIYGIFNRTFSIKKIN